MLHKVRALSISAIPPGFIILSVLGTIFLGLAPPTEAAAVGCLASLVLTMVYRKLNWGSLKDIVRLTLNLNAMVLLIGAMSVAFTGVFMEAGCGKVVQRFLLTTSGSSWGAFGMVMLLYFILGFFMDWIGIFFIMVPVIAPLAPILGFDPLWFGIMICINLQASFMTPPYACAIFVLRGVAPPEFKVTTAEIIRGVIPFILIIFVSLGLCVAFPQIILWLPAQMIK